MPGGIPVATMAIGAAGAKNAALYALSILAIADKKIETKLTAYKQQMKKKILSTTVKV
jgi:5-(carboxyamino)imidazole ribonucleotide mutase